MRAGGRRRGVGTSPTRPVQARRSHGAVEVLQVFNSLRELVWTSSSSSGVLSLCAAWVLSILMPSGLSGVGVVGVLNVSNRRT